MAVEDDQVVMMDEVVNLVGHLVVNAFSSSGVSSLGRGGE